MNMNDMELRDYFAAKAMAGFAADTEYQFETLENMAKTAYTWADALLDAREK